ncbi:MAG: HAMP domain-containing histidine kinase [Erysipelothrix sp.]|jgi:signal transduction histidine kinase|nr:HAMP domain-containing histidine kinase [Erysipelothrix sp.]
MKQSLNSRITFVIVLTVLVAVGLVSFFSSINIHHRFRDYIAEKQSQTINQIIAQISSQYDVNTTTWDQDKVHEIGMSSLYTGYIVKVFDNKNESVWDAEVWDMDACVQLINDVSERMSHLFIDYEGSFSTYEYQLEYQGENIGLVKMSYYGPYFYQENDLLFINQLQTILIVIAIVSILSSLLFGLYFANSLTKPLLRTIDATKSIASGQFETIVDDNSNIIEVSELINSVNHLSDTLAKQDVIKRQITADVAHELRTPLSILQISVEAIMDGIVNLDQKRIKSIYDEILRLSTIVKDIDQLNQIEWHTHKLDYELFDIKDLLSECIHSLEVKQLEKNIDVLFNSESIMIEADRYRLFQVFYNIIVNAYNYSEENSKLIISVDRIHNFLTIVIKDTGIGIPQESIPYLFERFYRVDSSRSRVSGGSGIGLTIVKQLIEAHGGTVEVDSEINLGTTFTIILPVKRINN